MNYRITYGYTITVEAKTQEEAIDKADKIDVPNKELALLTIEDDYSTKEITTK